MTHSPVYGEARIAEQATHAQQPDWREWVSGAIFGIALCWPFIVPSLITQIRWYMLLPLALVAGYLQYQRIVAPRRQSYPLWALLLVVLLFAGIAAATLPLSTYGSSKLQDFIVLAGIAYLATFRLKPITERFAIGFRLGLFSSLLLSMMVAFMLRDMFIQTSAAEDLRESIATTGLPLVIALAASALVTGKAGAWRNFYSSIAIVGVAVVEVLIRGRFDALALLGLAALLMVSPPWRGIFWRVTLVVSLGLGAIVTYQYILPQLGDSYEYFQRLQRGELAGRGPLIETALNGFMHHPLGQGLGSFERAQPLVLYPHNIILEVAYELGILGLLCMGAIYLSVFRRVWQLWKSPPHRVLAAPLLLLFLHMLKAGDLSMYSFQWVLLYMMVVVTPLATDWQISNGKERTR